MRKTYALVLEERGKLKGRREMLLRLLHAKFGEVSAGVIATLEDCADIAQLDNWSEGLLKARRLANVGISSPG